MKRVIFKKKIDQNTRDFIYPDDKKFFKNSVVIDENIISDYSGEKLLNAYLEDIKTAKIQECRIYFQKLKDKFMTDYNDLEIGTFSDQKRDYRAYRINNNAPTPTIDDIAEGRGMDRMEVIQKVGNHVRHEALMVGMQQAKVDTIEACETIEELEAIQI